MIERSTPKAVRQPRLRHDSPNLHFEEDEMINNRIADLTVKCATQDQQIMELMMSLNPFDQDKFETWILYELDITTIIDKRLQDWVVRIRENGELYLLRRAASLMKRFKERV